MFSIAVLLTFLLLSKKMDPHYRFVASQRIPGWLYNGVGQVMALTIFLSSSLRRHVDDYNPRVGVRLHIEPNTTVAKVCKRIGIPEADVKIVMVDGLGRSLYFKLMGDERVALFPPLGGG